jgi:hypothetical protein
MPRIRVDKQTGIQVAMKSWWITRTLFGSKRIRRLLHVEIPVEFVEKTGKTGTTEQGIRKSEHGTRVHA